MRAVVLVGGFGTRLRPLTCHRPKQMLPIVHRPMIEHVLGHLVAHGVDDVVLSLGFRPDAFVEAYPSARCAGARLHYAVEPQPLDTAGAVRFAAHDAGIDERFLVLNGDVLTDLDITRFVEVHDGTGAEVTIALHKVDDPSCYGVVPTGPDGCVEAFVEKPPAGEAPTDLINAGTYVVEPSLLGRIEAGRRVSIEREVFPALVRDRSLYAVDGDCYWIDTGTPATYIRAQTDLAGGLRGEPLVGVHPAAAVHPGATLRRSVVGPGATVEAGAVVEGAVVLAGAVVRSGAVVEAAVVGERSEVGSGARVGGLSVVGEDQVVAPGARLDGVKQPADCT
ncbi:MAG TPA: NDP-sugar synthase [Acidimicrobiales bacterium]|nr:NDP-sugar synthase [Acidimicrobiales bacterium]